MRSGSAAKVEVSEAVKPSKCREGRQEKCKAGRVEKKRQEGRQEGEAGQQEKCCERKSARQWGGQAGAAAAGVYRQAGGSAQGCGARNAMAWRWQGSGRQAQRRGQA